jgi:hypothetical protein
MMFGKAQSAAPTAPQGSLFGASGVSVFGNASPL